jgi:sigma-B regulation protein RsbU (phosphoserine phosphatase)
VLAAAGVHASIQAGPEEMLAALRDSLAAEFLQSESYFTVFYGMIDPINGRLTYANAGHPYAFRIPAEGDPIRLEATAPPLGLGATEPIESRSTEWVRGQDLLCLFTDGVADATNPAGVRFGEQRLLDAVARRRERDPETIVEAVMAEVDGFAPTPGDDRTLLVMRV